MRFSVDMPKIKFEKVISFSSEDPVHVASNLLSHDPTKKWKCKSSGELQASVVLQLEKPSIISHIDIGNEHSAYIEVLVNRSSSIESDKGLLVMSSFMTPLESRQSINVNKVRMFSGNELSKPECDERWDRIKIICTQPFNRHVQYGLSFITLHSIDDNLSHDLTSGNKLGKFNLREESPDNLSVGSLFARRKEKVDEHPLKAAAAIREASSSPSSAVKRHSLVKPLLKDLQNSSIAKRRNDSEKSTEILSRNHDALLYADDEIVPNDKIDAIINKKNEEVKKRKLDEDDDLSKKKEKKPKKETEANTSKMSVTGHGKKNAKDTPSKKEMNVEPKKTSSQEKIINKKKDLKKPFSSLLNGVTLVISGIQNPERANIRSKALKMGAKYKADWDNQCTHLMCAFMNTPKYNQVKGKGKIVNKMWIEECYSNRKKLPWRRYALDKTEKNKPESEDEICELIDQEDEVSIIYDDSTDNSDMENETKHINSNKMTTTAGGLNESKEEKHKKDSIYDADTDAETEIEITSDSCINIDDVGKFLNIFAGKLFYIDEKLEEDCKKLLLQHITAYNGNTTRKLTDDIDIVITSDKNVSEMRNRKKNCLFIIPDWVWKCHNEQKYIPIDTYEL